MSARTSRLVATAETAALIRGSLIARDRSVLPTRTVGVTGSVTMCRSSPAPCSATAARSARSIPSCRAAQVNARYIAPVSR